MPRPSLGFNVLDYINQPYNTANSVITDEEIRKLLEVQEEPTPGSVLTEGDASKKKSKVSMLIELLPLLASTGIGAAAGGGMGAVAGAAGYGRGAQRREMMDQAQRASEQSAQNERVKLLLERMKQAQEMEEKKAQRQTQERVAGIGAGARVEAAQIGAQTARQKSYEDYQRDIEKFNRDWEDIEVTLPGGERLKGPRATMSGMVSGTMAGERGEASQKAAEERLQKQLAANAKIAADANASRERAAKLRGPGQASAVENQSFAFWNRANQAEKDAAALEDWVKSLGLLGASRLANAPNILQTQNGQLYRQAQKIFTEARLRKESGAAIAQHEYDNDARMYFAQPGDTPETIERKKQSRQEVLKGLKIAAGRAYKMSYPEEEEGAGIADKKKDPLGIR
jgi:hypothetical protein